MNEEGMPESIGRVIGGVNFTGIVGAIMGAIWSAALADAGAIGAIWGGASGAVLGGVMGFLLGGSRSAMQGFGLFVGGLVGSAVLVGLVVWVIVAALGR